MVWLVLLLLTSGWVHGFDDDEEDTDLPWMKDSAGGSDYSMFNDGYPGWPGQKVPVLYDKETMTPDEIKVVKSVHADMNKKIKCIRFIPYGKFQEKPRRYLRVIKRSQGNGKSATVHYFQPEMLMVIKFYHINDTRYNRMVLKHESLHVLGLGHTIKRKDRDHFISLNNRNITPQKKRQYNKCESCDLLGSEYDCGSIMHYRRCRYGVEPCDDPKFEALDPNTCNVIDMNYDMSESDIQLARKINCFNKQQKAAEMFLNRVNGRK